MYQTTGTAFHVCSLCEASCGLRLELEGGRATRIRSNPDDVFSRGFACPKGMKQLELEADPDRLRKPLRRTASGSFEEIGWEQAFGEVRQRLSAIRSQHGFDAVAAYFGTTTLHHHDVLLVLAALRSTLKTKNWSGANSQDTGARFATASLLYGSAFSISVPDIERTHYLLCIGANPRVSNGSMMTAPGVGKLLDAVLARGGKLVVVDPRRTETARSASEHLAVRPGMDAAFVLSLLAYLLELGHIDEKKLARRSRGWERVRPHLLAFAPQRVSDYVGVSAETLQRIATEFHTAPSSVAYSRMGAGTSRDSTLACFAVELLNLACGRLGAVGGAMFPTPAIDVTRLARLTGADGFARYHSRVRGLPETVGELPATTLAEEIETPGPGQVRALLTYAGNPVLSVPNGKRLDRALGSLEFMVSVDIYVNETTRHADLILPPARLLSEDHVDLFFANMAVRNVLRWSNGVTPKSEAELSDWEILLRIAQDLGGGILGMPWLDRATRALGLRPTPNTIAGIALRMGPHGDHFLPWSAGLNRKRAEQAPNGIDLGPLEPGFERRVYHRGKRIQLFHESITQQLEQLAARSQQPMDGALLLIGRRQLRGNNSWMHNLPSLASNKRQCELFVHPKDAAARGLGDGDTARLHNERHSAGVVIRLSADMRPGVVSLPHGFGHATLGSAQQIASKTAGESFNDWTDDGDVDAVAGTSILNGIAVELSRMEHGARA